MDRSWEDLTLVPSSDPLYRQPFQSSLRKSDQRKIKLIEEAIRLIAQFGFDGLTYERLGKPQKMTRAHVNYYFQSRLEILEAATRYCLAHGQEMTVQELKKSKGWKKQIDAIVDGFIHWMEQWPDHGRVFFVFLAAATHDRKLADLAGAIRSAGRARVVSALRAGSCGASSSSLAEIAATIQNLCFSTAQDALTGQAVPDWVRVRRQLKRGVWALIGEV